MFVSLLFDLIWHLVGYKYLFHFITILIFQEEEEMSQISELGSGSMNNMMPHQSAAIVKVI